MQHQFFQVLNQGSAGTMRDAFGDPRCSRRIHDVHGVIERQAHKINFCCIFVHEVIEPDRRANFFEFGVRVHVRDNDCFLNGRDRIDNVLHLVQTIMGFAVVAVGSRAEHHPGLDLAEPVDDAIDSKIR